MLQRLSACLLIRVQATRWNATTGDSIEWRLRSNIPTPRPDVTTWKNIRFRIPAVKCGVTLVQEQSSVSEKLSQVEDRIKESLSPKPLIAIPPSYFLTKPPLLWRRALKTSCSALDKAAQQRKNNDYRCSTIKWACSGNWLIFVFQSVLGTIWTYLPIKEDGNRQAIMERGDLYLQLGNFQDIILYHHWLASINITYTFIIIDSELNF